MKKKVKTKERQNRVKKKRKNGFNEYTKENNKAETKERIQ